MKKLYLFISLIFFCTSCNTTPVAKPDTLLTEEEMTDVLYDIAILQAAQNYKRKKLTLNNVEVATYVFKKHKIDSTLYSQNHKYYASKPTVYKKITEKVLKLLTQEEAKIDSLAKPKKIKKNTVLERVNTTP